MDTIGLDLHKRELQLGAYRAIHRASDAQRHDGELIERRIQDDDA
jgi:hypothetical protein